MGFEHIPSFPILGGSQMVPVPPHTLHSAAWTPGFRLWSPKHSMFVAAVSLDPSRTVRSFYLSSSRSTSVQKGSGKSSTVLPYEERMREPTETSACWFHSFLDCQDMVNRAAEMAHWLEQWLLFQRDWVQHPTPTWQLRNVIPVSENPYSSLAYMGGIRHAYSAPAYMQADTHMQ